MGSLSRAGRRLGGVSSRPIESEITMYPTQQVSYAGDTLIMQQARARSARRVDRTTFLGALCALAVLLAAVVALSLQPCIPSFAETILPAATTHYEVPDRDAWYLVLVNDTHPFEGVQPELTQLRNNQAVDTRCYPDLQRMFDEARSEGLWPHINSSYRSRDEQQRILDETVAEGMRSGLSEEAAHQKALRTVAEPGTSEHETGLAIDVSSDQGTGETDKAVHRWMAAHAWEYGWILRYPAGKEALTGIDNEPWHFRYVGIEAARVLHESGLCLEEYLG